jgi:hypothetical protein
MVDQLSPSPEHTPQEPPRVAIGVLERSLPWVTAIADSLSTFPGSRLSLSQTPQETEGVVQVVAEGSPLDVERFGQLADIFTQSRANGLSDAETRALITERLDLMAARQS